MLRRGAPGVLVHGMEGRKVTRSSIDEVKREVKRFSERLLAVEPHVRIREDDRMEGRPETAALRRSSMDLTRALARLRR